MLIVPIAFDPLLPLPQWAKEPPSFDFDFSDIFITTCLHMGYLTGEFGCVIDFEV